MCVGRDDDFGDGFDDRESRHDFVKKVFAIVGIQLLITLILCLPFMYVDEVKFFARKYHWLLFVFGGISIVILLILGCVQKVRRSFPANLILLFVFTIAKSYIIGTMVSISYPMHVLVALALTVVLCGSLIIFAFQTKCDFTGVGPYLLIFVVVLMVAGIVSIFWHNRIFQIVIASFAILLFSMYLIVDVQMMLGGKHKYSIDPDDWVLAAISIYVDIVTIFIYILQLLGLTWDDD